MGVYWTVNTMWLQCILFMLMTHYGESSFQERHKMIILPKTESCFFLENIQEGCELNIRYLVMSSKNGKQLDITMRLRDNTGRMITYQGQKTHGTFNHTVKGAGDYEVCFNNRHSMVDSKKLDWEFDILGDEDVAQSLEEVVLALNQTMEEYMFQADQVKNFVWWLGMKTPKDTARLESIVSMIDTCSMAYSCLVVIVGFVQLFVLKKFFEATPTTTKFKLRI